MVQPAAVESSAIVVSREATLDSYRRGLEPGDISAAYKVATAISTAGLYGVRSAEDALARIMTGRELGLTAMQSLRGLYSVEGKIGIDASLMHALCLQSSVCEMFECTLDTDARVEYTIRRRGWSAPQVVAWTIEDATRAGLLAKPHSTWLKYPRQLLHARCKADGARRVFPEKLFGMYTVDELRDGVVEEQPAQPADVNVQPALDTMGVTQQVFLERIERASTDSDRVAVRGAIKKAVDSGELKGPFLDAVREAYNRKFPPRQRAAKPEPEAEAPPVEAEAEHHDAEA